MLLPLSYNFIEEKHWLIMLYHLGVMPMYSFPIAGGKPPPIHQCGSEGGKNKNFNKYFIRLFCDLTCASAWLGSTAISPFINALTQ